MKFWNKLSTTEKSMLGFIIALIILVALNWQHVIKGLKKGIEPYQNNQDIESVEK